MEDKVDKNDSKIIFVVAYCSDFCQVEPTYYTDNVPFPQYTLLGQYKEGLARKNCNYGNIISFNNRFWGIVTAETAFEAINVFIGKLIKKNEVIINERT